MSQIIIKGRLWRIKRKRRRPMMFVDSSTAMFVDSSTAMFVDSSTAMFVVSLMAMFVDSSTAVSFRRIFSAKGRNLLSNFQFIHSLIHSFIHSFVQEFIRRPFKKSTQRRPQPKHGDTDQS